MHLCSCSNHFAIDAYIPSHSPEFLRSINFSGTRKVILKPDALPTLHKPGDTMPEKKKRQAGILARKKVRDNN